MGAKATQEEDEQAQAQKETAQAPPQEKTLVVEKTRHCEEAEGRRSNLTSSEIASLPPHSSPLGSVARNDGKTIASPP